MPPGGTRHGDPKESHNVSLQESVIEVERVVRNTRFKVLNTDRGGK